MSASSILVAQVERGESLDEWAQRIAPDFPTILMVLCHIATRLAQLHASGHAHRDLKPANVLWRPRHHSWTLIDFGCAAAVGAFPAVALSTPSQYCRCSLLWQVMQACTTTVCAPPLLGLPV